MPDLIQFEIKDSIARIILNRADRRNALTRDMIADLTRSVTTASQDESVRVLTIAAEGTVFCAGMDLGEMQQRAESVNADDEWLQDSQDYAELLVAILNAPFPVVAVIQGPVLAGGVGIVLACDLVLASDKSFFALPEPQRGITAAMVTPLLIFRVGAGHASHMLLTTSRIPAAETVAWGLCHKVVPADKLNEAECELAGMLLSSSRQALHATKHNIRSFAATPLIEQIHIAARASAAARETDDAREGLQAFLEKRKPNWQP